MADEAFTMDVTVHTDGPLRMELSDPVDHIIRECADKRMKRRDVAQSYALAMRHSESRTLDWHAINAAILARWSKSGLVWIKTAAWSGKCWGER